MKKSLIIILVIAVVGVIGFQAYRSQVAEGQESIDPTGQVIRVTRGTLAATVNATGLIQPERQMALTFKSSGRIQSLAVQEEQAVSAGQLLAELETEDLELQIKQAEIALRIAQERYNLTQQGAKPGDIAAAEASLVSAKENLERLREGPTATQLAAAKAALDAAQANYDKLIAGPSEDDIRRAKLAVDQAKNSLWGAQNARDSAGYAVQLGGSRAQLDQAEAQVLNAEIAVTLAEMNYQDLLEGPGKADILAVETQLRQAEDTYQSLLRGPRDSDIAAAEAQIAQAENALAKLEEGASVEELRIAQEQVEQARVSLEQAQLLLGGTTLVAPFDGVITVINAEVGSLVSAATPVMTIVDLSGLEIQVDVDEIDIPMVQLDQSVRLTLDALPDLEIKGRVSQIASVGSSQTGILSYPVLITIDQFDPRVKVGMTANAEITTERLEDVLLVPNRAVRIDRTDGTYHVDKWVNGEAIDTQVKLGMRNDLQSQVIEGLEQGDELIIINPSLREQFLGFGG